jgi:integrase
MPLTQFAITKAVAADKPLKLSDGSGLHLLVHPNGSKLWRFRYRFAGRENMIAFGAFPAVSLANARTRRDEARKLIADGTDPAVKRKLDKIAAAVKARTTFAAVAADFLAHMEGNRMAEATIVKARWMLEELALPLARRPISEIPAAEVLDLLKRVEKSGRRETARRLRSTMSRVFRYAIATLRASNDPTTALRGALLSPNVQHRAALTDESAIGGLMVAIDEFDGWPTIRAAMQLLALTVARPGDIRGMRRSEIDFAKAVWRIPAERMKMRRPHDIPLSRQALAVLKDIWSLSDRHELVLPSIRAATKPLSENAVNASLRRMGYAKDEMTAHGFRSSASTILNERGFDPDVIEATLAHQDADQVRRAYNRATYWKKRVQLMQDWADILDDLRVLSDRRAA